MYCAFLGVFLGAFLGAFLGVFLGAFLGGFFIENMIYLHLAKLQGMLFRLIHVTLSITRIISMRM